jgi:mevalonate kinase
MKSKIHKLSTVLLFVFLTACTQATETPEAVANKYWQLLLNGNTQQAEKLLAANSKLLINAHSSRIQNNAIISNGPAQTNVSTTITTVNADNSQHSETFNTVLVLENNAWKVDINLSPIPPEPVSKKEEMEKLANELSESMQENMETIGEAMDQGMDLLNEALEEGSKDMSQSLLHLMNELNTSMKESIDQMKQRRQQQLQQDAPAVDDNPNAPDPRKGEGMI